MHSKGKDHFGKKIKRNRRVIVIFRVKDIKNK